MAYIVTNTDGSLTVTVGDTTVDTSSYSLAMIGRGIANYGQYFAQNTIRQLENFASTVAPNPNNVLIGQVWYDKNEKLLRVWDGDQWKRSTGILIGSSASRPTTSIAGGGASFYNTTTNKLEIHNGTRFREAAYAGEVSSAYIANSDIQNPTFYGSRIRNLFLTDENGKPQPVLAVSYVKATASGDPAANKGTTQIGEHWETIMALFSDSEFTVANNSATPVDGAYVINFTPELTGSGGIATARSGRALGIILQGMNIRAEYETSGVSELNQLFVSQIGSEAAPVTDIFTTNLAVQNVDIQGTLVAGSDLVVNGLATFNGDVFAPTSIGTFANLVVGANTTLNGATTINGNLTVNGVNTQAIGTDLEKIESIFAQNIDTQTITVDGTATVATLAVTTLNLSGALALSSNLSVTGTTTLANTTTQNLTIGGPAQVNNSLNVTGTTTLQGLTTLGSTTTLSGSSNLVLTSGFVVGAATQVNVTPNNATNETVYLTFVDTSAGGKLSLETDASLSYNPNTNVLTAGTLSDGTVTISGGDINAQTGTIYADVIQANTFLTPDGPLDLVGGEITASNVTANNTLTGTTITDGDLVITGGNISGVNATFSGTLTALEINATTSTESIQLTGTLEAVTITDGQLAIQSGSITGAVAAAFSGAVTANTLTDGVLNITGGSINSAVNGNFSGNVSVNRFNSHLIPLTTNAYDVGSSTNRWRMVYSSGASLTGNVTLGAAATNTITYVGRVNTAILPIANNAHDLGATSLRWNNIYANNINAVNVNFTGSIDLGDDTGDTISFIGRADTNIEPSTNNVRNLGDSARRWNTVFATTFNGVATSAQYADLAELYSSDELYEPGTLVKMGGTAEITITTEHADTEVFGVISTNPAYLMNSAALGIPVAMTGRVPVKVIGKVKKGERLISSDTPGVACAIGGTDYKTQIVIGRALVDKDTDDVEKIEVVVGVK